jgi:hypothetical protein
MNPQNEEHQTNSPPPIRKGLNYLQLWFKVK